MTRLRLPVSRREVEVAGLRLFAGGGGGEAAVLWRLVGRG